MEHEFDYIIGMLNALLAVEQLEYYNKSWLIASESDRFTKKQETLTYLIQRIKALSADACGGRPLDNDPNTATINVLTL